MKIRTFIYDGNTKHKQNEFLDCELIIKNGEIVEFRDDVFDGIFPREGNSELSIIDKIHKVHIPKERIPKGCKYYIQKKTENGLMNIYLDINRIEYFNLKWGMKGFMVQSKDFIIGLSIGIILLIIGLILK